MRGSVHHVDLTVMDPWASQAFYAAVLGFMGYRLRADHARGLDWDLEGSGGLCSIAVMKAGGESGERPHDRYSPGLHHLAWAADSRQDVDRMHELLLEIGATVLDPPTEYPQYREGGYYAVFFADPDGLKLEYVFTP